MSVKPDCASLIVPQMTKALTAAQALRLVDIPNIGVSIATDLQSIGVCTPADVRDMDPWVVYESLRGPMGQRHDPCVLDVFLAAHDFMNGAPVRPWWAYTAQRKKLACKFVK